MLTDSMSMHCAAHVLAGDYDRAIALSDQAFQISEASHNLWGQSFSRMIIGLAYWELGRPDQAIAMAGESVQRGKLAGFVASQVLAGGYLAAFYGNLGAVEQGLALARQAVAIAESQFPHFRSHPLGVLAQLHLRAGEPAAAAAVVEQGLQDPYCAAHPAWNMRIHLAEIELALQQERYEQTIALADLWLDRLRQHNLRTYIATILHCRGQAQLALGDRDAAGHSLGEARDIAAAIGSQAALWPILITMSRLEADPTAAEQLRHQARAIVETIAGHIDSADLRASFLNQPDVQPLFK
jgi:tetratricopeptide (TPR) repeat protein